MKNIDKAVTLDVKYRPTSFDEYITSNKLMVDKFKEYIDTQDIPHILLYGSPGTGKSSAVDILLNNIQHKQVLNIREKNDISVIKDKIDTFTSTGSKSVLKIVRIEEFKFSPTAQIELNKYLENVYEFCKFIITTNDYTGIIEANKSRFQKGTFKVENPSHKDIKTYVDTILSNEHIEYNEDDIKYIIVDNYPDIRRILGTIQSRTVNNKLVSSLDGYNTVYGKLLNMLINVSDKFKTSKTIRQLLADEYKARDFNPLISYLYTNLNKISDNLETQVKMISVLSETQYECSIVTDQEINFMNGINSILTILA